MTGEEEKILIKYFWCQEKLSLSLSVSCLLNSSFPFSRFCEVTTQKVRSARGRKPNLLLYHLLRFFCLNRVAMKSTLTATRPWSVELVRRKLCNTARIERRKQSKEPHETPTTEEKWGKAGSVRFHEWQYQVCTVTHWIEKIHFG
jgi:hypothetical protein